MDRRRSVNSATTKGLLSRQLASITDTLAKASQRRDAQLQRMRRHSKVTAVETELFPASRPAVLAPASHPHQHRLEPADAQLDGTTSTTNGLHASSDLASVTSDCDEPSVFKRGCAASNTEDNPRTLLAEMSSLRGAASRPSDQSNEETTNDLKEILAELGRLASPPLATTSTFENADPRRMLAELAALSTSSARDIDPAPRDDETTNDDDDDIIVLRARLQSLRTNHGTSPDVAPLDIGPEGSSSPQSPNDSATYRVPQLDPEVKPYVVALVLEQAGLQWEHAQGWTTSLFSSGLNSYKAQRDKETAVLNAEHALKTIIHSVMGVEAGIMRKGEETKLQRQLIISNLAASADEQEMRRQLWKYRHDITKITILPERDPMLGTKTAHIEMSSRKAALQASHATGSMYGLIYKVRLAVEHEN